MISFLSRTIDFFFFFLSLWICLWLAETSQQPISQTTWLKVTPHCNHCNHCSMVHVQTSTNHLIDGLPSYAYTACSFNLPRPSSLWAEETLPFCFHLFLRTFQQPNPFCCNRSTTNLFMIFFLSRTIDFFFFFLSLWIYLWLAKTSQQPISQTTWLKVTLLRSA